MKIKFIAIILSILCLSPLHTLASEKDNIIDKGIDLLVSDIKNEKIVDKSKNTFWVTEEVEYKATPGMFITAEGKLPKDSKIEVVGKTKGDWLKIKIEDKYFFIQNKSITNEDPVEKARKEKEAREKKEREQAIRNISVPPGQAKEAFNNIVAQKGLTQDEINGWAYIISRESGWNTSATNTSSGAYGIPQSLPGSKMSSHGSDWRTNPDTQLRWMYDYMVGRYGSIAGAVSFWNAHHWY